MPSYRLYQNKQTLCVSAEELDRCGVKSNTLYDGIRRQRENKVTCWPHHKEGKCVYIHYDGLKEDYQNRIKALLCGGLDPHLYTKNIEASKRKTQLQALNTAIPEMVEIDPADLEELTATGYYSQTDVHRLARAAGWLRLINQTGVKKARALGYHKITEFQEAVFNHVMAEQKAGLIRFKKQINNERVLDRNARLFAKEGITSMISGLMGNANRKLMNPVIHAMLMELRSDQRKLNWEDVAMEYNSNALDNNLPMLTVSAIKQHLNSPANKRVWYYQRHGKLAGDLAMRTQATRREVSRPDALWSVDGTTMQLYYLDNDGKIKSDLYVYLVADAYCGAIIGWSVGFSETAKVVTKALQTAVEFRNYIPYQLQYDNGSANISKAVSGLMDNMSRVHFGCRPYSGQSKYVETFIGHFQQQVLHKSKNFKGGNVNVKTEDAKANPELLASLKKDTKQLPNFEQVIEQFGQAVAEWNKRGEQRDNYGFFTGATKTELYETEHADRKRVNYFDKISLYQSKLDCKAGYKYTTAGIKLIINKKPHFFIVPDDGGKYDFIFQRNHLNERFDVKINLETPEFITLLYKTGANAGKTAGIAREKELFAACVADYKDGDHAKIRDFCKKQEEFGWQYSQAEIQKQRIILENSGLFKANGTDGIMHFTTQDKNVLNNYESQLQDELNGMTDLEKRLLKIKR